MSMSPYSKAPKISFWSRSVARQFAASSLAPAGARFFRAGDRVMSAGSCFAANIVPYLEQSGFCYVRTERRPPIFNAPPENFGYDNFSASYGNIYTSRQLLQLLRRARMLWEPQERCWPTNDGEFIDPFRPGMRYRARSRAEYEHLVRQHLECVYRAFTEASVFVFTLGLTEAWLSRNDGAVFPACPGTVAGQYDEQLHAFHNFSAAEVIADLNDFVREVREINPTLRIVLTVSPVPLVATATGRHVLTATTYSKAALRVAAEEVVMTNHEVTYFPAYEIVTGPQAPFEFYEADRRNVSKTAVAAVMTALLECCDNISGLAIPREDNNRQDVIALETQRLSNHLMMAECEEAMSDDSYVGPE